MSTWRVVHKYAFPLEDEFDLALPDGASIVLVDAQYRQPMIWALVEPIAALTVRRFRVAGTGRPLESGLIHVGSFQMPPFVWHLFERTA